MSVDQARNNEAAAVIVKSVLEAGSGSSDIWDAALSQESATPQLVAEAVLLLQSKKQYSLAVEGLESAIRNDLIEPWIYDVLAFEMKLAGRPADEIARVLASRVDFASTDVAQLLVSAALMSRFEAWDEAMQSCREATKVMPESEDAWLLARSIADKSRNPQHRAWARFGILRHIWGTDFELQHQEANQALDAMIADLEKKGRSPEAEMIRQQLDDARARDLGINLTWIGPADLDLIIREPGQQECSYRNRVTANGGRLIREVGVGDEKAAGTKRIEQYVCAVAPNGEYEIAVRFVLGKASGGTAMLEIVENADTPKEKKSSVPIRLERQDVVQKFTLKTGRKVEKK
ncbi:MAG: hypothetical protein ACK58L_03925 [Planctomycetota bacterium]